MYTSRAAGAAETIPMAVNYIRTAGYITAGDGGGALYKKVEAEPSNQGKLRSADGAWWEIIGSDFTVTQFGALGDGETDDRAAIQAAYDMVPVGGWLYFGKGKNYRINSKLKFNRSVNVDFCGSMVTLNNSTFPNNRHFDLLSTLGSAVEWTGTIGAGVRTFRVTNTLAVGDTVLLALGQDPHDAQEEHFIRMCKVTAASAGQFTVDVVTPYAINGHSHFFCLVTTEVAGVTIRNLVIDYVDATTPDVHCWIGYVHDCIFENIRAVKGRIIFNPLNSYNLKFTNINARVIRAGNSSHGRIFTGWQLENVLIENVNGTSSDRGSWFFWENWCRGVKVVNSTLIDDDFSTSQALLHVSGGSYDIEWDGLTLGFQATADVVSTGGTPAEYRLRRLRILNKPNLIELDKVESWADVERDVSFMSPGGWVTSHIVGRLSPSTTRNVKIANGVLRRLWIYIESTTGLMAAYLIDEIASVRKITDSLTAGKWAEIPNGRFYGSAFNNDADAPEKTIQFVSEASYADDQNYAIVVEYWPISGNAATFQIGSNVAPLTVSATSGTLPTANGTVTIANADTPTVVELLEYCRELEAKLNALRS
ncbi:hypothetical protein BQ8482_111675 [Mesorhizobium delmotii]|uniref:Rhamnogalacturonase A/B/Epimerase-like pectate lyase domain-containing protein n=1 Tax=Mesorhizobium delmotii TaxID=1631247 RepID=A0A2P9AF63_9HYPH|nr:hypothetical protein BQ8482_111675 [Mesorhizobium delmotii]